MLNNLCLKIYVSMKKIQHSFGDHDEISKSEFNMQYRIILAGWNPTKLATESAMNF